MRLNDFLKSDLLGNKFALVRGFEEVTDRETQKVVALRCNISIQDESSDFYMEMISVKINNLMPSFSIEQAKSNKVTSVTLNDLNVGQFNGNLWFSCSDIIPVK